MCYLVIFKRFSVAKISWHGHFIHILTSPDWLVAFYCFLCYYSKCKLPEHLSSPLVFNGVRVIRSLVLCICFVDRCLSICPFSFGHCGLLFQKLVVRIILDIYDFMIILWRLEIKDSNTSWNICWSKGEPHNKMYIKDQ